MEKGRQDRTAGAALMAVGVIIGIGAATLQVAAIARYGARTMPLVVGAALFVLGLLIYLQGKRAGAEAGSGAEPAAERAGKSSLPVTLTFVLLAAYVVTIEPIGFPVATFFYVLGQTYILSNFNARKLPQAFCIALVGTVLIHHIFTNYFHVLLPSGILG